MDSTQLQQVASLVKQARERKGWTQERLATEAGVSANTVIKIEKGIKGLPGILRAVLDVLEVDPQFDAPTAPLFALDVETIRNLVGLYLEGLDPEARQAAVRRLLKAMATQE